MSQNGRWTKENILPGLFIGVCTAGVTFLVTWGSINTRVEKLEKSVDYSGEVHERLRQELIDVRAYREANLVTKGEIANHRLEDDRTHAGMEHRLQSVEAKIEEFCVRRSPR